MQVGILGPLVVADGVQSIEIGGARLRALLIRLAAGAGGWVSVGELVEALWESDPPGDEINALQSLVSRLRRALPVADLIESGPAGYRLAVDPEDVDAIRFEHLAVRGRQRLADGDPEEAAALLSEALGLWHGTALTEVADAAYAMTWAERLNKLRLTAIENRADAGLRLGRHPELIADLEDVTAEHPLRERSHELLIRALAGSGRQAEALAVYDRLSRRLAGELGLDPPIHLQRLQTAVLRDDPALLPRAQQPGFTGGGSSVPARSRRTNLRSPLTSFVGRDSELRRLDVLIHRSRLTTLVGTGGAGKTRLASEATAALTDIGTDGVWMVELAPVTDPEDVASTALGSIGALEQKILDRQVPSHRDALSRLVESLAEHDVVLILDNCEHLVDAAAKLAEYLLGQCPRLTVLATSREPLGVVGESLWPVHPLPLPDLDGPLQFALTSASVQLFMDRAALVRPGFELTPENHDTVMEICRRLDGLPLAIELAAARLRNLTVEAVAARLGDRFRLLSGGNRTAMPRHQTLRAVVAWSWELLTESERILAERLSVFPGGATMASATAVCSQAVPDGSEAVPEDVVGDLLMSLADKSLLVVVEPTGRDDGAQPRYRMLETIREFAAERLAERDEMTQLRSAHARYFLELAETGEPHLRSSEQLVWLDLLTAERDNLLATMRFAVETSDADTAQRLGAALSWYWTLLGRHDEATNWLGQALAVPGEGSAEAYAIVFIVHALNAAVSGRGMPESDEIDRMLELVSTLDIKTAHPMLSLVEPGVAVLRERDQQAAELVERNLAHPDPWARAMLNLASAVLAENNGDIDTMIQRIPLALKGFRELGDRWGVGTAIGMQANVHSANGEVEAAIETLQEARRLMTELHASEDESYALIRIGLLRLRLGDGAGARRDVEAAVEIADRAGSAMSSSSGMYALATLAHHEGRTDEGRRLAEEGLVLLARAPMIPPQALAVLHCAIATFDIATGALDDAAARLVKSYTAVMESRDMPVASQLTTVLADLLLARADAGAAATVLGAGIAVRGMEDRSDLDVRRVADATRAALGEQEYARRHAEGRNLSRDDALGLLRAHLDL